MEVDNRAPWDIFRERKDGERESPGTLFGAHSAVPVGCALQIHIAVITVSVVFHILILFG